MFNIDPRFVVFMLSLSQIFISLYIASKIVLLDAIIITHSFRHVTFSCTNLVIKTTTKKENNRKEQKSSVSRVHPRRQLLQAYFTSSTGYQIYGFTVYSDRKGRMSYGSRPKLLVKSKRPTTTLVLSNP